MLSDIKKIFIRAGKGGDSINKKNKYKEYIKNKGGKGGDIIIKASNNIKDLEKINSIIAKNGHMGKKNKKGRNAIRTVINIPVGTKILSKDKRYVLYNFNHHGEETIILRGGKGAKTKMILKYLKDKTFEYYNRGEIGKEICIWLDMKLISRIGIVGFPNVGKSTLLSNITYAKPKVSNYNFTTLKPNLGLLDKYIIADIPGICLNAHLGYGIGISFLKHLEKCKIIVHIVEVNSINIKVNLVLIKKEIKYYISLVKKKEIVILSKLDLIGYSEILTKKRVIEKLIKKKVLVYSSNIFHSFEKVRNRLVKILSF